MFSKICTLLLVGNAGFFSVATAKPGDNPRLLTVEAICSGDLPGQHRGIYAWVTFNTHNRERILEFVIERDSTYATKAYLPIDEKRELSDMISYKGHDQRGGVFDLAIDPTVELDKHQVGIHPAAMTIAKDGDDGIVLSCKVQ